MHEKVGRILGIDYGKRRIGIAVSDPTRIVAQGLPTIVYKTPPDAFKQIAEIVDRYEISEIVVGLPLTLKGELRGSAEHANRFVEGLKEILDLPVSLWDERFTSKMAEDALKSAGKSPRRNREHVDRIAAVLILQSYLDSRARAQEGK